VVLKSRSTFEDLLFAQAAFQPFTAAPERLQDRLGEDASRRCKMVRANPTVPLRPSFSSESARLNSSRT